MLLATAGHSVAWRMHDAGSCVIATWGMHGLGSCSDQWVWGDGDANTTVLPASLQGSIKSRNAHQEAHQQNVYGA